MAEEEIAIGAPSFYERAFLFAAERRKEKLALEPDNFKRICAEEYTSISQRVDRSKLQDSCAVRNVLRTRRLANLLINDKGELNLAALPKVVQDLTEHLYSLGPERQYDAKREEHLLQAIKRLAAEPDLQRLLKNVDKPTSHKYAEQMIRDTLALSANVSITTAHARRAALSAWLCLLRQNVGSCFATAPAIIVQAEQPHQFFKDLIEILGTGRLRRTFGGVEYSVPLSMSWGSGDLKRPFWLPRGEAFEAAELWLSPGLLAAMEAMGFIDPEAERAVKDAKLKEILQAYVVEYPDDSPQVLTSSEEVLTRVLLKELKITEKDLKEYENRPRGMVHSGLLMQTPIGGGKGDACASFHTLLAQGSTAFKLLADNALLKAWEFTLASFAETKAQFTRWNLYSSLGLGQEEKGGIGACLYQIFRQKLEEANKKVADFQFEYEQAFAVLKTMESRVRSVSSEKEAQWLKAEYQAKRNEFYTLEELRDKLHYKAQRIANFYNEMIDKYDALFPQYFQEVYDADMHDVTVGPYDDSPAGFRLLYKYGRSNTSHWSLIKNPAEFIDALASFFTATENELAHSPEFEGMQTELSEIVTAIVNHVRGQEFLETAFYRMAAAHGAPIIKNPLENLDKIEKKPWAYTSGGTMATLVSCYYKLSDKPTDVGRWVESPTELLTFLSDTIKQIPQKLTEPFLQASEKSLLIHSPTHAFLLKPGREHFKEIWTSDAYTYTWVRDNYINPRQRFIDAMVLDEPMMQEFIDFFSAQLPLEMRHYFRKVFGRIYLSMNPVDFREHLLKEMDKERGLKIGRRTALSSDEIDSALYSMLPLFPRSELKSRLEALFKAVFNDEQMVAQLMQTYENTPQQTTLKIYMNASELQSVAKGLLCLTLQTTTTEVNYHLAISRAAQHLGFAMPQPISFADTNWVKDEFGFVVNPGTGKLELWRIDLTGRVGTPMSVWDMWVDGSRKQPTWGVYVKPYEYTS